MKIKIEDLITETISEAMNAISYQLSPSAIMKTTRDGWVISDGNTKVTVSIINAERNAND